MAQIDQEGVGLAMMKVQTSKKLQLKKETLGALTEKQLSGVGGGTSFGTPIFPILITLAASCFGKRNCN